MSAGTRALDIVRAAGIAHTVHAYAAPEPRGRDRAARPAYGLEAAVALGVAADRVFKTLVAVVDERMVLAVIPVDRELDLKRLAAAAGGRHAAMAEPAAAERATGSVIGGISPIATRRVLPVVVDTSAGVQATVFVSAGRRGVQLELAPEDLVRCTNATVASVARDLRTL